ncbi:MAG: ABC-type transport auxiliary lipoprotein family protein [Burkholderiaceae bacterium]
MPDIKSTCRTAALGALTSLMVACATPSAPVNKTTYDFGEIELPAPAAQAPTPRAPLALAEIQTAWGQSSTAMQYRLAYANAQQVLPYREASWRMPPAQLVAQTVRAVLAQQRPVVSLGEGSAPLLLQLTLESFGQSFKTPTSSQGSVRLRATLLKGDQLLAQRAFATEVPAATADAAGGARALSEATRQVATELASWLGGIPD